MSASVVIMSPFLRESLFKLRSGNEEAKTFRKKNFIGKCRKLNVLDVFHPIFWKMPKHSFETIFNDFVGDNFLKIRPKSAVASNKCATPGHRWFS